MAPWAKQESSTSVAGPSKARPQKKFRNHPGSYSSKPPRPRAHEDALPGVQKLKSALRQTKRLLAKDNLAADVRVETERRSKALEADLARAEHSRKERQYATRYHKVKFFGEFAATQPDDELSTKTFFLYLERQKVVRKINQTKRSIATSEAEEAGELESALADLRVDLNYILVILGYETWSSQLLMTVLALS